jgi:uncharacterized protein
MKTAGSLADRSKTELANLARSRGIRGWADMDKGALVKVLSKAPAVKPSAKPAPKLAPKPAAKPAALRVTRPAKPAPKPAAKPVVAAKPALKPAAKPAPKPVLVAKVPAKPPAVVVKPALAKPSAKPSTNGTHAAATKPAATKPLVPKPAPAAARDVPAVKSAPLAKDRILLVVSNPYWLCAHWELSSHSVQRAEAALRQDWHGARLIIRLFDVTSADTTSTSETPVKDVTISGTGHNWYIDVPQPPRAYRADIGYVSRRGDFYMIARSNVVTTPKAGSGESVESDAGWEDADAKWNAERMLAMSNGFETGGTNTNAELREFLEERTGRSLGPPKETAFGTGAVPPNAVKKFFFEIDAKLVVFGRTDPTAHLTLNNDPIKLNADGSFRMIFNLPDSRQIIPAVAASADGVEERTIVLAIERNTKHLDPMIHDQMNDV